MNIFLAFVNEINTVIKSNDSVLLTCKPLTVYKPEQGFERRLASTFHHLTLTSC